MTKTRLSFAAGLFATLALGACHSDEPQTNVEVNTQSVVNETEVTNVTETPTTPVVNTAGPTNAAVPPAMSNAESVQVEDDAAATGMTSHVDRGNQSAPAQ